MFHSLLILPAAINSYAVFHLHKFAKYIILMEGEGDNISRKL